MLTMAKSIPDDLQAGIIKPKKPAGYRGSWCYLAGLVAKIAG
jgi:hypothetical protein